MAAPSIHSIIARRYLAELELRLHLAAEDVDAALELDSSRALQRIPAAVQDIAHVQVRTATRTACFHGDPHPCSTDFHAFNFPRRLMPNPIFLLCPAHRCHVPSKAINREMTRSACIFLTACPWHAHPQGDIAGLKADVGRGLGTVSAAAAAASANVALLVELERVKSRMEAACSTLKVWGAVGSIPGDPGPAACPTLDAEPACMPTGRHVLQRKCVQHALRVGRLKGHWRILPEENPIVHACMREYKS